MALTRKMLKAMGIEDDKIDQIIEAHTETVEGLKDEAARNKKDADKLKDVQKELDDLKAAGGDWQKKYEAEKKAHDQLKADNAARETKAAKTAAFRQALKDAGVADKYFERIVKISAAEIDGIELDKDGKAQKTEELVRGIKEEWGEYVVTTKTTGAAVAHPPANTGTGTGKTRDEIMAIKDGAARRQAMVDNSALFPELGEK